MLEKFQSATDELVWRFLSADGAIGIRGQNVDGNRSGGVYDAKAAGRAHMRHLDDDFRRALRRVGRIDATLAACGTTTAALLRSVFEVAPADRAAQHHSMPVRNFYDPRSPLVVLVLQRHRWVTSIFGQEPGEWLDDVSDPPPCRCMPNTIRDAIKYLLVVIRNAVDGGKEFSGAGADEQRPGLLHVVLHGSGVL